MSDSFRFQFDPERNIIPAPQDPSFWPEFREQLAAYRESQRRELNYSGTQYDRPEFSWVSRCFSCAFAMLCDELLYDSSTGCWTPERFLEEGSREFGGYDAVLLWHGYPRMGLDDRNQFDFFRDQPGGLPALRNLVLDFQQQGVKVFIAYCPWDTSTRREEKDDGATLADFAQELGIDGIFLDTMNEGSSDFRTKLESGCSGVALESELVLPINRIQDHHLSWAQWFDDSAVPGVLRNKWFEPRHMQHQIKRWNYDHSAELHSAWMNGSGVMVWENVFGSWMGWSGRDKSFLRAMLPIQRRYAGLFAGERWTPLVPTLAPDLFASRWDGEEISLWTIVNRSAQSFQGDILRVEPIAKASVFDLVQGRKLEANSGLLSAKIAPLGLACFVVGTPRTLGNDFARFLAGQRDTSARADSTTIAPRLATRLRPVTSAPRKICPTGMAEVPSATVSLKIELRERECGFYETSPPSDHRFCTPHHREFTREVTLNHYAMDLTPVTNAQYQEFLESSGYYPKYSEHFLRHWMNGTPPPDKEDHPVVYVDLEDARAFANWAGKRLPTEEEWQYAAAGPNALAYPWGNDMLPGHCNNGEAGDTTSVRRFPAGRSPAGIYDLCGNVWELTESEYGDRTRFCLLRGGSFFTANASHWYMDGGARPNSFAAKMLLHWPGLDRCATIGFRCAIDLPAIRRDSAKLSW